MERSLILLVFLVVLVPAAAATDLHIHAEPFAFREISLCKDDGGSPSPYGPGKLLVERLDESVRVTGWATFQCGVRPTKPEVIPDWGSITLSLTSERTDLTSACFCTSKFEFLLRKNVPSGRVLYLVKDGRGNAHAVVP